MSDKKVITAGTKIESSQAALLDKLKIRPFSYKMNVKKVYENGEVFEPSVLDITPDFIRETFKKTATNMAAASMASGYITKPAIPHIIANSFKNLGLLECNVSCDFHNWRYIQASRENEGSC